MRINVDFEKSKVEILVYPMTKICHVKVVVIIIRTKLFLEIFKFFCLKILIFFLEKSDLENSI